jgi:hypothetical protein
MRELIGYWYGGYRVGSYAVYLDHGVMFVNKEFVKGSWNKDIKREIGKRFFGDSEFLIGVINEYVTGILFECDGKDEKGVREVIEKHKGRREERRAEWYKKREEWEKLREKFDGIVIGVDSQIDVFDSGFSVRVLFSSDVTFGGRKQFLAENKIEFVKWVMQEIRNSKAMTRRIGDMKFYKPVEIINLRAREVEVKFEVKKEVA